MDGYGYVIKASLSRMFIQSGTEWHCECSGLERTFSQGNFQEATVDVCDKVSYSLVNVVEHLADKEPELSLRSWLRPNMELNESVY